jgi:hypothetical protein
VGIIGRALRNCIKKASGIWKLLVWMINWGKKKTLERQHILYNKMERANHDVRMLSDNVIPTLFPLISFLQFICIVLRIYEKSFLDSISMLPIFLPSCGILLSVGIFYIFKNNMPVMIASLIGMVSVIGTVIVFQKYDLSHYLCCLAFGILIFNSIVFMYFEECKNFMDSFNTEEE